MGKAIKHRGPDDSNIWIDSSCRIGMAHQRLAVIDLTSAGAQPMVSQSGRYTLSYNGEIYNHLSLRQDYFKKASWRGHSDTETLLALIEKFGIEQVPGKLTGMFSFAVWDRKTEKLHLIRDRFGEKPLYYGQQGNTFFFTSDLQALIACRKFNPVICTEALALYFRYFYVPSPYSIYEQIFKAPAASIVTFDSKTSETCSVLYWSIESSEYTNKTETASFEHSVSQLDDLLHDVVSGQLLSDVPVGAFLSGGTDSSTIVSVLKEVSNKPVKTYCIGFTSEAHNEAPYAKAIARSLGTEHTEHLINDDEVNQLAESIITVFDEPFADSSQIPTFAVAMCARQETTVCLSGDGGDELFGGYTRYRRAKRVQTIRALAGSPGQQLASRLINHERMQATINGVNFYSDAGSFLSNKSNNLARLLQLMAYDSIDEVYRDMVSSVSYTHLTLPTTPYV